MRLLFVDDDRINILLFEQVCLQVGGIDLRCAESGTQALSLVAQWRPQLLVLDLHLPDTNGFELLPRLRLAASRPALPAVLCTAELASDVAPQAQAAGFDHCWAKPILLQDIAPVLQQLAAAHGRETPP